MRRLITSVFAATAVAAPLALLAGSNVHAGAAEEVTAAINVVCVGPQAVVEGRITNPTGSSVGPATFTVTITHPGGGTSPGGASWPSIDAGNFGYHTENLSLGDTVSATITVTGLGTLAEITDIAAPDCIGDGTTATIENICDGPLSQLVINISNTFDDPIIYAFEYTITPDDQPVIEGDGGANVGSASPYSQVVVGEITPGDLIEASISSGDNALATFNGEARDCVAEATDATIELACVDGATKLIFDVTNNLDEEMPYNVEYDITTDEGVLHFDDLVSLDPAENFHFEVDVETFADVDAMVNWIGGIVEELHEPSQDCSGDGSGAGLPDSGSNTTPLMLAAAGLLAAGALLSFGVRRRRTA